MEALFSKYINDIFGLVLISKLYLGQEAEAAVIGPLRQIVSYF